MAMGMTPSSEIAQRFANNLIQALCHRMDAVDAPYLDRETGVMAAWLERRRALPHDDNGSARKLYVAAQYTDDPLCHVVGVDRAVRLVTVWHEILSRSGLMVAKADKWQIGAGGITWLGIKISAQLGLAWVAPEKVMRAIDEIRAALSGDCNVGDYRKLIGFLEHLFPITNVTREAMDHLYGPLQPDAEIEQGTACLLYTSDAADE